MNSITQEMQFRQSQMQYCEKHGVNELPANTTNVSRTYTFDKPARMTLFLNREAQSQKYPMGNQIYGSYLGLIVTKRYGNLRNLHLVQVAVNRITEPFFVNC